MAKIYGRLLNSVSDYLGLTGPDNVGEVDIESLILTHDVRHALLQGIARNVLYSRSQFTGAASGETSLGFHKSDISASTVWRESGQQFSAGDDRRGFLDDWEILIYRATVFTPNGDANFETLYVEQEAGSSGRMLMAGGASRDALDFQVVDPSGAAQIQPLPWFVPRFRNKQTGGLNMTFTGTDAVGFVHRCTLSCIGAPQGILSPIL